MNMLKQHQLFLEREDQQQSINLSRFNTDLLSVRMKRVKVLLSTLLIHLTNHAMSWVIFQKD